jgi:hypothetical protein
MTERPSHLSYASNLDGSQLLDRGVRWRTLQLAVLPEHRLVMNKRGVIYPGFAVANIEPAQGYHVEGVVYTFEGQEDLDRLSRFEQGYDLKEFTVETATGNLVQASAYIAKPEFIVENLSAPPQYIARILEGGQGVFSKSYEQDLRRRFT